MSIFFFVHKCPLGILIAILTPFISFRSSSTKEITPKSNWCPDIYIYKWRKHFSDRYNLHKHTHRSAESKRCNTERTQTTTKLQYYIYKTRIAAIIEIRRATGHIIQTHTYSHTRTDRHWKNTCLMQRWTWSRNKKVVSFSGERLRKSETRLDWFQKPKKTHTKHTHIHTTTYKLTYQNTQCSLSFIQTSSILLFKVKHHYDNNSNHIYTWSNRW